MKTSLTFILLLVAQTCSMGWLGYSSSNLVGKWKIEIKFSKAGDRLLHFEALASGKGSFLVQGPRSNMVESAKPTTAKWAQSDNKVTFSGFAEFPIGNVGRDSGTLVFKGSFENDDSISGDVAFFPTGENPDDPKATPSQTGTFKATRLPAE